MTTYPLPIGTTLPAGTITGLTLTAYTVTTPAGATIFVPFAHVHPLVPATPLVALTG